MKKRIGNVLVDSGRFCICDPWALDMDQVKIIENKIFSKEGFEIGILIETGYGDGEYPIFQDEKTAEVHVCGLEPFCSRKCEIV